MTAVCPIAAPDGKSKAKNAGNQANMRSQRPLFSITMVRQLLNIMDQAVQLPLRINLPLSAQREAIQALVGPQVAENGLYSRHAPTI
jgi:hypothetical protein